MTTHPRLAVLADFAEEEWVSMDLCATKLVENLPRSGSFAVSPGLIRPPFRRGFTSLPVIGRRRPAFNADRTVNRFLHYPRHARRQISRFDLFHVVDHSYAQLVHALPCDQTGVYCHDIDAFRCLIDPTGHPRPFWFRKLAHRILLGLRRAAVVFYSTVAVQADILDHGLVESGRLVHAPYGVSPEFQGDRPANEVVPLWLEGLDGRPWMLHVGSCVPRKRIDVLLDVFARVREKMPETHLVKVGGEWSGEHREQIGRLGLAGCVRHVRGVTRAELAEAYRRAGVVLVTSRAEGFGLPVIEALACGSPVLASDIPALREAGGPAATYAPVGNIEAWVDGTTRLLAAPSHPSDRAGRIAWASRFTWSAHAEIIAQAYHGLL